MEVSDVFQVLDGVLVVLIIVVEVVGSVDVVASVVIEVVVSVDVKIVGGIEVEVAVVVKRVGCIGVEGSVVVEVVIDVVGMEVDIGRVDRGVVVISANTVGMVLVIVLVFIVFVDGTLFFVVGIVLILWVIVYGGVAGVWVITGTVVGVWDELIAKSLAVVAESVRIELKSVNDVDCCFIVVPFPFTIFESPVCNEDKHTIKQIQIHMNMHVIHVVTKTKGRLRIPKSYTRLMLIITDISKRDLLWIV